MAKKKNAKTGGDASNQQSRAAMYPLRPIDKPGGTVVKLISNFFRMSIKQEKPIYQYSVVISVIIFEDGNKANLVQKKLPSELRGKILEHAMKNLSPKTKVNPYPYVYDANAGTMFTLVLIDLTKNSEQNVDLENEYDKKSESFQVRLTGGNLLDLQKIVRYCNGERFPDASDIQQQLRAINVIMRARLREIQTNVFSPTCVYPYIENNQKLISPGIIINKGFAISARPTQTGLTLNIANTSAPFYKALFLTDFLRERWNVRSFDQPLARHILEELKKEFKMKQVEATHINYGDQKNPHYRRYRIKDITGSSLDKFNLIDKSSAEPKEITIKDYFLKEHKVKIKYPNLPCVIDTNGRKVPLELCKIAEKQRVNRKLNPNETSETLKVAAMKPERHFAQLREFVDDLTDGKKGMTKPLSVYGLELDPSFIHVDGREMKCINMQGASGRNLPAQDGQYRPMDRFIRPATINKWGLFFIVDPIVARDAQNSPEKALNNYCKRLGSIFSARYCAAAREKGMRINDITVLFPINLVQDREMKATLNSYFQNMNKNKIDHGIFILPDGCPDWIYRYLQYLEGTIKTERKANESCTRVSCIKYSNLLKKIINHRDEGKMFIGNLLYKYNTKLGGVNYVLENDGSSYLQDGYIFISIDVCHPAPGDKLIQSVAAAVGMWDVANSNMSSSTCQRVQKKMRENHSTIEEVGEIGVMVDEILSAYFLKKKKLPTHIVILRDGVSEGQFRAVLESELTRVKTAIRSRYLKETAQPQVACFVVQKRHRTRFRRLEPRKNFRNENDYNIQPGTVVDNGVVHPTDHDFYIAPHKAIQGTSQPLHIYAIFDEIQLSQQDAQEIVFKLSHLSPRCNKGTSIPTTVNMADRAAERGKNIVISWSDDNAHLKGHNEEDILKKLNKLFGELGDANYKNTLYYI